MPSKKLHAEEATAEHATVFPVDGVYLSGIPHVPTITTAENAERLIRTGAFTGDAPVVSDGEEALEMVVSQLPPDIDLDFYDPPAAAEPTQPEGPADAGPSDSPEV